MMDPLVVKNSLFRGRQFSHKRWQQDQPVAAGFRKPNLFWSEARQKSSGFLFSVATGGLFVVVLALVLAS